jgi:hypothetical protein
MSRPLRNDRASGRYDLTGWGNARRAVFRDDRNREHFCELLGESSDCEAVSMAIRRYEERLRRSPSGQTPLRKVCQMCKVEM